MKKVIRHSCFESNSSSNHTLSFISNYYSSKKLSHGIIKIYLGEYGWSGSPCCDFEDKLSYAMSMVLNTEYPKFNPYDEYFIVDQDVLESLEGYRILLNAINLHIKCDQIVIKRHNSCYPYGYIDHQSHENYGSLKEFFDDWNVDAERFLFDDGVSVIIDNDNH